MIQAILPLCALLLSLASCARSAPAPMLAVAVPAARAPMFASAVPATYQWVGPPSLGGNSYKLIATGAGIVYEAHCVVQAIAASDSGGTTIYIYFIDRAAFTQPTNGTASINGGVSGGMNSVGDEVTWRDTTNAVLSFTNGIMLAASATPDTFTRPNGAAAATDNIRCDVKLRSTTP